MKTDKRDINFNASGKKDSPFKVPEGYFDNLANEIISRKNSTPSSSKVFRLNYNKVAAMLAIISLTASTLYFVSRQGEKPASQVQEITRTNPVEKHDNSFNDNKIDDVNIVESKKSDETNSFDTIQKINSIKAQNQIYKIEIATSKPSINSQKNHQIFNKSDENFEITENLKVNPINNSLAYNNITYPTQTIGGGSNDMPGTSVARTTSQTEVLNLISKQIDTCSSSSLILNPFTDNSKHPEFSYHWNNGSNNQNIKVASSGTYIVDIIANDKKSEILKAVFNVKILPKPLISLEEEILVCSFETVLLKSGVPENAGYKFSWSNSDKNTPNILLSDLKPGIHDITLNIEGCGETYQANTKVNVRDCKLQITNVITPNGDGKNEKFMISGIENYPNSTLIIMDRNGKLIYENHNYSNDWDGDGHDEGTYYYLLKLNDGKGTQKSGFITIIKK